MNGTTNSTSRKRRGLSTILGVFLIVIALVAVLVGRGTLSIPGLSVGPDSNSGQLTQVNAVIGSEKREFFEDPAVAEVFARNGYEIRVSTAGSRRIATEVDLSRFDLAFPSSAPAAQKIIETTSNAVSFTPFFSPMAIATFEPIMQLLHQEGVATRQENHWIVDIEKFLELSQSGKRWRDLGTEFPSPRNVQFSSTDIRTSNSAAMYLSILSWVSNDGSVVASDSQVSNVIANISPLFLGQGFTESTSAAPFADYLAQGIGAKPMVIIYEAQYLAEQVASQSRIQPEMTLAYPSPTVLSNHTAVGLTDAGKEVGRLISEDQDLQLLAVKHGFRPQNPALFDEEMSALGLPNFLNTVDPPAYDYLEKLIEGISMGYSAPAISEDTEL